MALIPERGRGIVDDLTGRIVPIDLSPLLPHEPTGACEAVHCHAHGVDEPGPHYRACGECGHGWRTAEALLADHAALVERLNAGLPPPPWDPAWYGPIVAETDPERVRVCPHCSHDL